MIDPVKQVFQMEALLRESLSFLDIALLGNAKQTAVAFWVASPGASYWKVQADKIHGHHCSSIDKDNTAADSDGDFKEQVRRYFQMQKYTQTLEREHESHFLHAPVYIPPNQEPELPLKCSHCSAFPNLATNLLLFSKYRRQQHQYAFFVRMSVLDNNSHKEQPDFGILGPPLLFPRPIVQEFLRIQEVIPPSPDDTRNGQHVTLRLNLSKTFDQHQWPALVDFLGQCRYQQQQALEEAGAELGDANNI